MRSSLWSTRVAVRANNQQHSLDCNNSLDVACTEESPSDCSRISNMGLFITDASQYMLRDRI